MSDSKNEETKIIRELHEYTFSCRGACIDGEWLVNCNRVPEKLFCLYCGHEGVFSPVRKFEFRPEEILQ